MAGVGVTYPPTPGVEDPVEACNKHLGGDVGGSEEHTSELQSQSNIVCRPLLEKTNVSGECPLVVYIEALPTGPPDIEGTSQMNQINAYNFVRAYVADHKKRLYYRILVAVQ